MSQPCRNKLLVLQNKPLLLKYPNHLRNFLFFSALLGICGYMAGDASLAGGGAHLAVAIYGSPSQDL
jgi:hypothetical protein